MTKKELYRDIASRHTPAGIRILPPPTEPGIWGRAQPFSDCEGEEQENDFPPFMQVPEPTTLGRLWSYLHECTHMRLHRWLRAEGNNYSRGEAEAEFGALQIFEAEGLHLSLRHLRSRRKYLDFHIREDEKLGTGPCPTVRRILREFDQRIAALEQK